MTEKHAVEILPGGPDEGAPANAAPKVALFQPPIGIGLGHVNRLAAIALALRSEQPQTNSLFTFVGTDHDMLRRLGLPSVPLPAVGKKDRAWTGWSWESRERVVENTSESLLALIEPAVVVFDCIPHAMLSGLCHKRGIPICFVARKCKSMDEYTLHLKEFLDAAAAIIVPHERREFALPPQWENKTYYVGEIVRHQPISDATSGIAFGPGPNIVITAGGGGYKGTVEFYNLVAEACSYCRKEMADLSTILVTGPLFAEWGALRPGGASVLPMHWDLPGLYRRASLVICQAGYNTVAEVVRSNTPAICIPGERVSDDQFDRGRLAAANHPAFRMMERPTSAALSAAILSLLKARQSGLAPKAEGAGGHDGAAAAARVVANIIQPPPAMARS